MPFSKLKNLMLLILLLVNAILLSIVIPQRLEVRRQRELTNRRLEELFASYDLALDSSILPDETLPLTAMQLEPDSAAALTAAQALLGTDLSAQDDAGRLAVTYRSGRGTCVVSRGGSFTAALGEGSSADNLGRAVSRLLSSMGIRAASVSTPVRKSAGVYEITAVQELSGAPVYSSVLTFTFRNGVLRSLSGTVHLTSGSVTRAESGTCVSCADALTAFLASRDKLGWVGSAITGVGEGYLRSETASAAVVRLTPGWRIATDTGVYWVNGITREVSALKT